DLVFLEPERAHVLPPVDEARLPRFEGALELLVFAQVDVVRNSLACVHVTHVRLQSNSGRSGRPYIVRAPRSPTAFGRWKIQFCHAERRPKILVSSVSGPANLRLASIPVSASGESESRSSIARRTSSDQSRSSGATVTGPASSAAGASRRFSTASARARS